MIGGATGIGFAGVARSCSGMTNDESRLRLADYLSHMLEAARLARGYVEGVVKADFLKDRRTQQAVVLNLDEPRAPLLW